MDSRLGDSAIGAQYLLNNDHVIAACSDLTSPSVSNDAATSNTVMGFEDL